MCHSQAPLVFIYFFFGIIYYFCVYRYSVRHILKLKKGTKFHCQETQQMNPALITSSMNFDLLRKTDKAAALSLYRMAMGGDLIDDIPQDHLNKMKDLALVDHNNRPHSIVTEAIRTFYSHKYSQ